MQWVNGILVSLAVLSLVPVVVVCAECIASLFPRRRFARTPGEPRPAVSVLIPAHNESIVLRRTLSAVVAQLTPMDRLVVVADNCVDNTAYVAREFPAAEVVERNDPDRRGKGFALHRGIRHIESTGHSGGMPMPQVLVVIDADCIAEAGAIDALSRQVSATGRAAQACYLLTQPPQAEPRDLISAFAFLVKNSVRPSGLAQVGLPCMLTGTGMAFPWEVIRGARLDTANIVEDMQLAVDLTLQGQAALFCRDAQVTGQLPERIEVAYKQRTRWEHGHLQTLLRQVPRLFRASLSHRSLQTLVLSLELAVPPLALLVMLLAVSSIIWFLSGKLGASWLPLEITAGGIALLAGSLLTAWVKFGRGTIPFASLLSIPIYVAWKVPMYAAFLFRRQTEWVRTARAAAQGGSAAVGTTETHVANSIIEQKPSLPLLRPVTGLLRPLAHSEHLMPSIDPEWDGPLIVK